MFEQQTNEQLERIANALELIALVEAQDAINLIPFSDKASKAINELAHAVLKQRKHREG